jgi:hypothetical protein
VQKEVRLEECRQKIIKRRTKTQLLRMNISMLSTGVVDAHRVITPKHDTRLGKLGLSTITQFGNALLLGAMITTEKSAIFL